MGRPGRLSQLVLLQGPDSPGVFCAAGCGTGPPSRSAEGGEGGLLNIMYRADGSDLKEALPEHWSDYRGPRSARTAIGACDQLQRDAYGEAIDSILFADERGLQVGNRDEPNTVLPLSRRRPMCRRGHS